MQSILSGFCAATAAASVAPSHPPPPRRAPLKGPWPWRSRSQLDAAPRRSGLARTRAPPRVEVPRPPPFSGRWRLPAAPPLRRPRARACGGRAITGWEPEAGWVLRSAATGENQSSFRSNATR